MEISTIAAQNVWNGLRQGVMDNGTRNTQTNADMGDEHIAPAAAHSAGNAEGGQDAGLIAIDPARLARGKIIRQAEPGSGADAVSGNDSTPPAAVMTPLKNVGPNTYERILRNADKAYQHLSLTGPGETGETDIRAGAGALSTSA